VKISVRKWKRNIQKTV